MEKFYKLTSQQKSLWILKDTDNGSYNIPVLLEITGNFNTKKLIDSVENVYNNTAILRSNFTIDENGNPIVKLLDTDTLTLNIVNVEDKSNMQNIIDKLVMKKFDLDNSEPLMRGGIFINGDKGYLLLVFHHLIMDEWSTKVFLDRVFNNYSNNKAVPSDDTYLGYGDKDISGSSEGYWKEYLKDANYVLNLPTYKQRENRQKHVGDRVYFKVNHDIKQKIENFAKNHGYTPYMIYYSIFVLLLGRYANQKDIIVGTLFANRLRQKFMDSIGYYAATLPIRTIFGEKATFKTLFNDVKKNIIDVLGHSNKSLDEIVKKVNPPRDTRYNPLVQVLFVYQNVHFEDLSIGNLNVRSKRVYSKTSKLDLTLTIIPHEYENDCFMEFDTELFDEKFINSMCKNYIYLLEAALNAPEESIYKIGLTTNKFSKPQNKHKITKNIVEYFQEQVEKNPNKIAVEANDSNFTYSELDSMSNKIANFLLNSGIETKSKIGVFLHRDSRVIASILGILKTGSAYVPIDTSYPKKRIDYILKDAGVKNVITVEELSNQLPKSIKKVLLDGDSFLRYSNCLNPRINFDECDLAYVIYTSGSTGNPKGVMVKNKNITRLILSAREVFNFTNNDVWTMFHSYAFDYSVWELWGALLNGAKVIILPYKVTRDPEMFYDLVFQKRVTILSQTPSAFKEFQNVDSQKKKQLSLKYVVFGGEKLQTSTLIDWYQKHDDTEIKLVNMYGITEATVHATAKILTQKGILENKNSTIGRPLDDLKIYIVDSHLNIVPDGVIGEMVIVGDGVASGYLNRPKLNSEKFLMLDDINERLFRTGDLAKKNCQGELEYIGRADRQVKIRGFRVELGEIESALMKLSSINNVTVVCSEINGSNSLVAYVVDNKCGEKISVNEIKEILKEKLPSYMLPNYFVDLDSIPLTSNGKVAVNELPKPNEGNIMSLVKGELPKNGDEEKMLAVWRKVLGNSTLGVNDNFFDAGGHSLLAVRLMGEIRKKFGKNLPISELFENNNVRDLVRVIKRNDERPISGNLIVPLKKEGNKLPLFLIHPGMGQVMCFKDLAFQISDHPIYGVRLAGMYGEMLPFSDVKELARKYIQEIKKVQAKGPYSIGGYCVGGIIAAEIVRQLRAKKERVNILFELDIKPLNRYDHLNDAFFVSFFVEQFFKSFDIVSFREKTRVKYYTEEELISKHFSYQDLLEYMLSTVKKLKIVDNQYSIADIESWYIAWKNLLLGINEFDVTTIDVPIVMYHAKDGDYFGGEWDRLTKSTVRNVSINGNHYTFLRSPYVDKMANDMMSELDRYEKI